MIRFKLKELISKKEFMEGRRITLKSIAEQTGINRMTLTKINTQPNYSTSTDTLNKLCEFFNCEISELIEFIPEKKFKELQKQQLNEK